MEKTEDRYIRRSSAIGTRVGPVLGGVARCEHEARLRRLAARVHPRSEADRTFREAGLLPALDDLRPDVRVEPDAHRRETDECRLAALPRRLFTESRRHPARQVP